MECLGLTLWEFTQHSTCLRFGFADYLVLKFCRIVICFCNGPLACFHFHSDRIRTQVLPPCPCLMLSVFAVSRRTINSTIIDRACLTAGNNPYKCSNYWRNLTGSKALDSDQPHYPLRCMKCQFSQGSVVGFETGEARGPGSLSNTAEITILGNAEAYQMISIIRHRQFPPGR